MKHPKTATLLTITSLLLFFAVTGFAQEAADASAGAKSETILQNIKNGGPLIMIIWVAIVATSITMFTFVIQNFIVLRKKKLAPDALFETLEGMMEQGQYQEAWHACEAADNYMANVLKTGLSRLGRGKEAVEDAIAESALRETQILRTRNSYLSVIGVVSPMIGLLGTVIGMMGAFQKLGAHGISDTQGLATSIGEVLMATASGLFIAIPAFIFYYIFRNRAQAVIVYADDKINTLIGDIPFKQLQGMHFGEKAGTPVGIRSTRQSAGVGLALSHTGPGLSGGNSLGDQSTNCPVCNVVITAGQNPCPHCGATLDWS